LLFVCRAPLDGESEKRLDPEDLVRLLLYESFNSQYLYIISPWISSFRFSKKFIYYPYVSTYDVVEMLDAIRKNGVKVYILIRCFDDFLSPDMIYALFAIYKYMSSSGSASSKPGASLPHIVVEYLKGQLEMMLNRLETSETFIKSGFDVKSDLGARDNTYFRLHAKIYINEKFALVGSANFTRSGVVKGGNWECLMLIERGSELYNEVLKEAERLYNSGKDFTECVERLLMLINDALKPLDVTIKSLDDLKIKLKELYLML